MLKYILLEYRSKFILLFSTPITYITANLIGIAEKYIFEDTFFVLNLTVVIFIDTILGFLCAWKNKTVSSIRFGQLFLKILVYLLILVSINHATMSIKHRISFEVFNSLEALFYAAIMVRELLSILEKAVILGVTVPPWLIEKLKQWHDLNKNPEQHKTKEENNQKGI